VEDTIESLRAEVARLYRQIQELTAAQDCPELKSLSQRERQILLRIGHGLTTREVAKEMHLSTSTIETYRERMKSKLGLTSGNQLLRFAVLHSLQKPEPAVGFPDRLPNGDPRDREGLIASRASAS
jgi:DNA-binding NarL/FixJ family response regulator